MGKIVSSLTPEEMITAAMVGVRRQVWVLANQKRNNYSAKGLGDGFQNSIISAMGEFVVAREFNLNWPDGVGHLGDGDVGGIIEVRTRPVNPGVGNDMGFKLTDTIDSNKCPKNKPFILVHADMTTFKFKMVGWIYAKDGWAIGKPASEEMPGVHFVKPTIPPLREIAELYDILYGKNK